MGAAAHSPLWARENAKTYRRADGEVVLRRMNLDRLGWRWQVYLKSRGWFVPGEGHVKLGSAKRAAAKLAPRRREAA